MPVVWHPNASVAPLRTCCELLRVGGWWLLAPLLGSCGCARRLNAYAYEMHKPPTLAKAFHRIRLPVHTHTTHACVCLLYPDTTCMHARPPCGTPHTHATYGID